MKSFEDGETVVLYKPGHKWHLMNFKAYKSQYTPDAYRLKYGEREILVDVSEIKPLSELNDLLIRDAKSPRFLSEAPRSPVIDDFQDLIDSIPDDDY